MSNLTQQEWLLSSEGVQLCKWVGSCSPDGLIEKVEGVGGTSCQYITNALTDTQVLVTLFKGSLWIVPRSTKERQDIIQDLKFWRKSRAHAGFKQSADSVWRQTAALADSHPDIPVVCAGHSLGGAVAVILGSLLAAEGRDVHIATFGQPRVYGPFRGKRVAKMFHQYYRWVNDRDIVTRLPLALMVMYRHIGRLMLIKPDGKLSHKTSDWTKIRIKGWFRFLTSGRSEGVSDHSVKDYEKFILSMKPEQNTTGSA